MATKLNFRFHDPNPPEVTSEAVLRVFMEVNGPKVERAIAAAMGQGDKEDKKVC